MIARGMDTGPRVRRVRWRATVLLGFLAGCGGGGGSEPQAGNPPPPPPPPPPPTVNVNIDNPKLTVADNEPVTPGGPRTLVWSDEFDADRLDPRTWYFETGDGGQYGIPGWGTTNCSGTCRTARCWRTGSW